MNVHGIKYVTLFYVAVKALLAKCLLSGPFDAMLCSAMLWPTPVVSLSRIFP